MENLIENLPQDILNVSRNENQTTANTELLGIQTKQSISLDDEYLSENI